MTSGNELISYMLVGFLDPLFQNVIQDSRMLSVDDVHSERTTR